MHQHDVEVTERGELLSPESTHGHQGDPQVGTTRLCERLDAQLIRRSRALGPLSRSHRASDCGLVTVAGATTTAWVLLGG